jgi:peptidoglycan pentaglycine glycine transferase (the first glycine)
MIAVLIEKLDNQNIDSRADADDAWQKLIESTPASGFMQSSAWGAFKQKQDLNVVQFKILQDDMLVAGCLGYYSQRNIGARLLVSPEGPVLPWHDEALTESCMRALTTSVESFCRENTLSAWRIEPRLDAGTMAAPLPAVLRNFKAAPIELVPKETLYLDIARDEETLLAELHHKARYNIRLAKKQGVAVRELALDDYESFDAFYAILAEAAQRDDFFLEPKAFFVDLLEHYPGLSILLAEHEGDVIGALMTIRCGPRVTYLYGGVGNLKRNLMAGYLLQWQAICAARALGATIYDFYGYIEEEDPNHLYCQFSQFKKKFGGTPQRFCGPREIFFLDTLTDTIIKAFQEIAVCAASEKGGN